MANVFVSRPTWTPVGYENGVRTFLARLSDMQLIPRTVGATDYPTKAPLGAVIDLMKKCQGAIILGLPQIELSKGKVKGEPSRELILSTEWNHIEAALAYAQELPLLVVHHVGVSRGIFDHGTTSSFIYSVDMSHPTWSLDAPFSGALDTWRVEVAARMVRGSVEVM